MKWDKKKTLDNNGKDLKQERKWVKREKYPKHRRTMKEWVEKMKEKDKQKEGRRNERGGGEEK